MSLIAYDAKRDLNKTPEPTSRTTSQVPANIFVVQEHHATHLHYDFRLEIEGVLKSWAMPKGPSINPRDKRLAIMTEDHPLEYANFSGVIPAGSYGAGKVEIWDRGSWEATGNAVLGLKERKLEFTLYGKKLRGQWILIGLQREPRHWLLIKKKEVLL